MSYCHPQWISDYTYTGVYNWRSGHPSAPDFVHADLQPCIIVWGRIVDGRVVLEPSFQVLDAPVAPARERRVRTARARRELARSSSHSRSTATPLPTRDGAGRIVRVRDPARARREADRVAGARGAARQCAARCRSRRREHGRGRARARRRAHGRPRDAWATAPRSRGTRRAIRSSSCAMRRRGRFSRSRAAAARRWRRRRAISSSRSRMASRARCYSRTWRRSSLATPCRIATPDRSRAHAAPVASSPRALRRAAPRSPARTSSGPST